MKGSESHTFVDVAGVGLLPGLATLLLVARWSGGGLLAGFLLVGWCLASWGLAASGGLLLSSFGRHFWDLECWMRNAKLVMES
jgi:hypothetical protein